MKDQVRRPILLSVLAHPDDETFGMGGTLALYARKGVDVHLVCATRGEVGSMDPELMKGFSSVGEVRESELRCAAGVLGLKGVHFLDYRDSGMPGSPDNSHPQALAAAPLDEVAAKVAVLIRKLQPQVVLTFDPIGGYRHPDHIAIQRATVEAFKQAADPAFIDPKGLPAFQPQCLFFHTIPRAFIKSAILIIRMSGQNPREFGSNKDIDLVSIASENFPVHARIDYSSVKDVRDKAAACHVSQGGAQVATGIQAWLRKLFQTRELFMQFYPEPVKALKRTDLFEGVDDRSK
jgi:LmbE family N-acetylglucosaminyl deacetylase